MASSPWSAVNITTVLLSTPVSLNAEITWPGETEHVEDGVRANPFWDFLWIQSKTLFKQQRKDSSATDSVSVRFICFNSPLLNLVKMMVCIFFYTAFVSSKKTPFQACLGFFFKISKPSFQSKIAAVRPECSELLLSTNPAWHRFRRTWRNRRPECFWLHRR